MFRSVAGGEDARQGGRAVACQGSERQPAGRRRSDGAQLRVRTAL